MQAVLPICDPHNTQAILFDLDGTLLDTAPDIYVAAVTSLTALSIVPPSFNDARQYIGSGLDRFIKRLLTRQWWGEPEPTLFKQAKQLIVQHYSQQCTRGARIYDGVKDTLTQCQRLSIKTACITNKPIQFTLPLLEACELRHYFHYIHCGDSSEFKKPNAQPIDYAIRALNVNSSNTFMVGDSPADSNAAHAAGIACFIVSYGYYHDAKAIPYVSRIIDSISDIFQYL